MTKVEVNMNITDINKKLMLVAYFPKRKEFGNLIELVKISDDILGKSIQLRISELNSFILGTEDKYNSAKYIIKAKIFNFLEDKIDISNYKGDGIVNYVLKFNYENQNELNDLKSILDMLTRNDLKLAESINQEASQCQDEYNQIINFSASIKAFLSKKTKQVIYNDVVKVVKLELDLINQYQEILINILDSLKPNIETSPTNKAGDTNLQLTNGQKQFIQELETLARDAGCQQELDKSSPIGAVNDIKEWMFEQDKYIELAYAMQSVRNDWSDGVSVVESALDNFKCCTIRDNEIHTEIKECLEAIENKETDGRVFRDCRYNYDFLFSLVDNPRLLKLAYFLLKI